MAFKFKPGEYRIVDKSGNGDIDVETTYFATESELNEAIQTYVTDTIESCGYSIEELDIVLEEITTHEVFLSTPKFTIKIE